MADISNGVLYGLFTFSAFLGGTLINTFGPHITMIFGATGYPIYIGGLWYFDVYGKLWFPILAGVYLEITAGCLWSDAGMLLLSPSTYHKDKSSQDSWAMPIQKRRRKEPGAPSNSLATPPEQRLGVL